MSTNLYWRKKTNTPKGNPLPKSMKFALESVGRGINGHSTDFLLGLAYGIKQNSKNSEELNEFIEFLESYEEVELELA
jgi:hypothetical protein